MAATLPRSALSLVTALLAACGPVPNGSPERTPVTTTPSASAAAPAAAPHACPWDPPASPSPCGSAPTPPAPPAVCTYAQPAGGALVCTCRPTALWSCERMTPPR